MELQIKDLGTDFQDGGAADSYWDGASFVADSTYVPVAFVGYSSGTWSTSTASVPWQPGRRYRITARAYDVSDNYQDTPGPIFAVDRSSPVAGLVQPGNLTGFKVFPVINGTASDGLGVVDAGIVRSTYVQVAMQRLDNMTCWTGVALRAAGRHPLWKNAAFTGALQGPGPTLPFRPAAILPAA